MHLGHWAGSWVSSYEPATTRPPQRRLDEFGERGRRVLVDLLTSKSVCGSLSVPGYLLIDS